MVYKGIIILPVNMLGTPLRTLKQWHAVGSYLKPHIQDIKLVCNSGTLVLAT